MVPIEFDEANKKLTKPQTMTDAECSSLDVWTDNRQCISCWKPSLRERLSILFNGKVWLSVHSGETQPPVWLDGSKTVFIKAPASIDRVKNCCSRIFKR